MRESRDTRPVKIMAQDEGRFGRINIAGRCWAPPRVRPIVGTQIVREYIYAYSAVCPASGELTSLILPYADTNCMNIFLGHVSKENADYFIIMQVDGAGGHKSKGLKIPSNMRLVFQPPYSPQLNPTEHIWDEIREKSMKNVAFRTMKDVVDKLCDGLNKLRMNAERVRSMTLFPHLNITF